MRAAQLRDCRVSPSGGDDANGDADSQSDGDADTHANAEPAAHLANTGRGWDWAAPG